MEKGQARLQTEYFKILREIDFYKYTDIMDNIEKAITTTKIEHSPHHLKVNKFKRSLDFFG